jgi:hypothetical protein
VLQYWNQVSLGYLTFTGSRMFPWVDIEIDASDREERSRGTLYRRAKEATEAAGHDLDEFDAFFVLAHPRRTVVNYVAIPSLGLGGPTEVRLDAGATTDGDRGVAVLNPESDLTAMCHELGHAIGWNHTFGLWNHGSDWDGQPPFELNREYGDPYDVMSSATFGSRWLDPTGPTYSASPSSALPTAPVSGWPDPVPWRGAGPGVAQAHLHLYAPDALERHGRVVHVDLPDPGETRRAVLWAASSPLDGTRTTLIAVHPPTEDAEGRGRHYVEYRDTNGWDRGLDTTGGDLARRAVVIHRLADGAPGEVRCWYQGRILVPLEVDADATVRRLPLAVRVLDVAPDAKWVTVELTRTTDRAVFINRRDQEQVVGFDVQRTDEADTLCGRLHAEWGARRVVMRSTFLVRSYGFGGAGTGVAAPPVASWTVAGKPVDESTVTLDAETSPGRIVTVDVTVDPTAGSLTLASRPDDGQYRLDVVAVVSEANGTGSTASTAVPFQADGLQFGYRQSIQQQLRACIEGILDKARVRPQEIFIRPFDAITDRDVDRIHRIKLTTIADRLHRADPALASELQHLITLRYGATPANP